MPSQKQFEQFLKERKYLQNVSPHTIKLYEIAWTKFQKYGPDAVSFVSGMREAGQNAIGCNIHIRSLNAFLRWAGEKPVPKLKA